MHRTRIAVIALAGGLIPLLGIRLLATTVAWSVPAGYFSAFKAIGLLPLGLMLLDTFVTFGVAYGVPALVLLIALRASGLVQSALHVAVYVAAAIAGMRVLAPLSIGAPIQWPTAPLHLSPELAFVIVGLACVVTLRLWPNNSSKPTPLRGAA